MMHIRLLCSPKTCFTLCSLLYTQITAEMCICYTAFPVKTYSAAKNVQQYILYLKYENLDSPLHNHSACEKSSALKAFTVILWSEKKRANSLQYFQTFPHQRYLYALCQGQKSSCYLETLNSLFSRHATKWQIKGKLVGCKLVWAWKLVRSSHFFLGRLCRRSMSQAGSTSKTL